MDQVLSTGTLTPEDVVSIFHRADINKDGIVSGNEAVAFFNTTGLGTKQLHAVWERATAGERGGLTTVQFSRALRLVALIQAQQDFSEANVARALEPAGGQDFAAPSMGVQFQANVGAPPVPAVRGRCYSVSLKLHPSSEHSSPSSTFSIGGRHPTGAQVAHRHMPVLRSATGAGSVHQFKTAMPMSQVRQLCATDA